MPPSTDLRRVVETTVHSRARLVTSDSACKRYFGSLWKSKTVSGTVKNVETKPVNGRNMTFISILFSLPNREKECTLPLCSVKLGSGVNEDTAAVSAVTEALPSDNADQTAEDSEILPTQQILQSDEIESSSAVTQSVSAHERQWNTEKICMPLNGSMQLHQWKIIGPVGDFISSRHVPQGMEAIDYFMWMFPTGYLHSIVEKTNARLRDRLAAETSGGELLKFFGVMILITRLEFSDRRELWSPKHFSSYLPAPSIGRAMSRNRFEMLKSCISFSGTHNRDVQGMARWSLVNGFVQAINQHRLSFVTPSHALCVDESMSRWYGLGGDWIDVGLPHYTALDRKPENGLEMKTVCCGRSGIMLKIELNMGSQMPALEFSSDHGHGTAVLLRLVQPWFGSERLVCADSFFASVHTANSLLQNGLRFTGVIKTATRGYPMKHLSEITLSNRGEFVSMVSKGTTINTDLMAVMWVDRERRYFISTSGTVNPGTAISRERWRREGNISKKIELEVSIPEACEEYYKTCSMIDRHNRSRQDDLKLEKKIEVKEWSFRVNCSLLAICIVDAWNLYKASNGGRQLKSPHNFYCELADELIENTWDQTGLIERNKKEVEPTDPHPKPAGTGIHLMQTGKKRKRHDGSISKALYQGRCNSCGGNTKSKFICSDCHLRKNKDVYLCHTGTGRDCFALHLDNCHGVTL